MRIVLASASPRRLDLLRSLGLDVDVIPSGYDEPPLKGLSPRELATTHAEQKCAAVLSQIPPELPLVAADTVVELDGRPFGKPRTLDEARAMLEQLSGRTHCVHTAFAVAYAGRRTVECETTGVTFFRLARDEIEAYLSTGEPLDKAGAYGIQGYGATLVERIDGDFYTVMGLPVARLVRTLRRLGFHIPPAKLIDTPAI